MSYRDRDRYDSPPRRYRDDSPPRGRYNDRGGGGGGRDDRRRAGSPRAPFGKRLPSPAPPPGLRYPRRRAPLDGHNNSDTLHRPPRETRGPEFSCRSDSHDEHINLAEDIYDALVKEDKPVCCPPVIVWNLRNMGSTVMVARSGSLLPFLGLSRVLCLGMPWNGMEFCACYACACVRVWVPATIFRCMHMHIVLPDCTLGSAHPGAHWLCHLYCRPHVEWCGVSVSHGGSLLLGV